jgi:hypothetical protein
LLALPSSPPERKEQPLNSLSSPQSDGDRAEYASGRVRQRAVALGSLLAMLSLAAFGSVQLVDGLHADAATCRAAWCAPPAGTTTSTAAPAPRNRAILRPAIAPTPPAPIRRPVVVPTTMRITTPSAPAPTIPPDPTTCAGVVAGIAWPPGWRVQCGGPRAGLLGATEPNGVSDLFVRPDESMSRLRVVALHEAGHAWDFARLDETRIATWCTVRGCNADEFFAGAVSSEGWSEASGAEDWASVWGGCHGGEYHRSYLGLSAPRPSDCALQNTLVGYPS